METSYPLAYYTKVEKISAIYRLACYSINDIMFIDNLHCNCKVFEIS